MLHEIPACSGKALALEKGRAVKLVNTKGSQVVDTWALNRLDTSEYLSVEHTRRMLYRLVLEEDTSPGRHDMLLACCDKWLYQHYGCAPDHANCRDNYLDALFAAGFDAHLVPNPLNLWMNIP